MSSPTETSSPPPPLPKSPPPPPPRRTVSATHSPSPSRPASSLWARARAATTTTWDAAYKLSDKVGVWSNAQAAKVGTEAFYPTSLEIESAKAARILRTFTMDASELPEESIHDAKKTQKVLRKIPPSALEHAQGLAIFTVLRTGFLVSGSGGSGVVLARLDDGSWSAPSGILLHTVGFGFLAGVDVYDVVLILRTQSAVQSFTHPRFSLGGEINVALGPTGAGHLLETSIDAAPSPVWSYSKSKGVYAGVHLDGQVLIERNDENERSYGREIKASQILSGEVSPLPIWCEGLHQTILAASGKPHNPSSIPTGTSPSDVTPHPGLPTSSSSSSISSRTSSGTARRLPVQELDEEDLEAQREMEAALRDFGIEDPNVNATARREDPLLVVEREEEQALALASPPVEQEREGGYGAEGILSEVVEQPPDELEREERRRSGGAFASMPNSPKPPLPPRRVRTPKVEQGEVEEKGEVKEEEGGEKSPEFKDAVELEGEGEGEGEGKKMEESVEETKEDATESEEKVEDEPEEEKKESEGGEEKKEGSTEAQDEGKGDKH
ncbi:hypothetical protein BCR35DRAFT_325880 [Leucosporidium creatinivorum]|uniref:Ysc84 actin-binding domain-containing protein n=1 Tax=Leucosporidium creatinivorum TaxID=106004 RepID=A0A1Y2ETX5_9BASI|nr:hypothetical protein BCR35DRAFT_325880 [Leucosporidium creatinivorum]